MDRMVIAIACICCGRLYVLIEERSNLLIRIMGSNLGYYALSFPGLEDTQALALSHRSISRAKKTCGHRIEYISKEEGP